MAGVLVLITGVGRSGTSTMSGTLHHLGLHVPGPFLGANDSNPKGFFESRWSVRFHNRLTEKVGVNAFDSRPEAFGLMQGAVTPRSRERLFSFVAEIAGQSDQLVVKDPRTVWLQRLWAEAAHASDLEIRYLSMLRHPAESVSSRATYYAPDDAVEKRRYALLNTVRWINNSLINERETRGEHRAYVRYIDLLADWRAVAARLESAWGLRYAVDPDFTPHPVDDFIDPGLRRHEQTWDDIGVPAYLAEVADGVWEAQVRLALADGVDEAASRRLDELAEEYAALMFDADALNQDVKKAAVVAATTAQPPADTESRTAPTAAEVPGRELLRELGRRTARRVGRGS